MSATFAGAHGATRARVPSERPVPRLAMGALRHGVPCVVAGATRGWRSEGWTLDALAARFGDVRVDAADVADGRMVVDARDGLVLRETTIAAVVSAMSRGEQTGCVTTRLDALPAELRAAFPAPAVTERAPRRVSKLWISPLGTVSALHFDLSDNLHAVVTGRKRFVLFAPRDGLRLYPHGPLSSVPNGARVDPESPDLARFPRFAGARALVADVGPGDAVYVPRGWWHHVRTLEPTLSVNTWWADGGWRWVAEAADALKRLRGISR